jgi:hypothetical protein
MRLRPPNSAAGWGRYTDGRYRSGAADQRGPRDEANPTNVLFGLASRTALGRIEFSSLKILSGTPLCSTSAETSIR